MIRLKTFGELALESNRGALGGAAHQKRRLAILAVLAVAGPRGVSRDKLLGLLWPEVDETRGRQALSQSLYALRRDTGEAGLVAGTDVLRLDDDAVTTDVGDFERALASNEREHAVGLYAGSFLDGVYLSGAGEFERWVDGERARLAHAAERALESLALDADARGDHRAAADWWRRLVTLDPLKTRANVGLMSALAAGGERTSALRHVERYAWLLREELDAEPGVQVRALTERLRAESRVVTGEQPAIPLGERFVLERELGRGGMAVVFLARDRRHSRHVALKMLHAELGAAVRHERLEREIMVTASLQHPHIVPLHDSGEHEGTLYYVMPFVDGESLRARLSREQRLPVDDAIRITREVADALDHAHRRGVVHRDIKPENILLADGHAVVADFGIAHLLSTALDRAITQPGMTLGTPAYMSPEQIAGGHVDGTSDIYSLGCVLFEMLTGRPPWIAANIEALVARRFTDPPPTMRSLRPDIPSWLEDVVLRMLAESPEGRFGSAADLAQALSERSRRAAARLPAPPDALVGRDRETAAASALLTSDGVRLLTFTGAGGSGKTRLALQVAVTVEARFDAVYFVDLSSVSDLAGVAPAIADAMDVRGSVGTELLTALATHVGGSRILLVLDNFEQIVQAAPSVARLLTQCPALHVLVTSRIRLGLRGEHEFFVAPLALTSDAEGDSSSAARSPAVELFIRRAREARADLGLDDDTLRAITAICQRLDGLPLAIELAAARCRVMSPRTVLTRLEKGFDLLAGGARDMPERHHTMRQAIAWSYGLLPLEQQDLFARLAVFAGGCTVTAVEEVCGDGTLAIDAATGIEALLDASLLMRAPAADEVVEPRLRMLETVREFALDRLGAAPDGLADRMMERHRAWVLRLVRAMDAELTGERQGSALAVLAAEHPNLMAGFDRMMTAGDAPAALGFAASIWRYWLVRRGLAEGRDLIARALSVAPSQQTDAVRADAMIGAGQLAQNLGDVEDARVCLRHVWEIRRRLGDEHGIARALADLGWIGWRQCDYVTARTLSNECLALARRVGDDAVAARALGNLGFVSYSEGDLDAACEAFAQGVALRERLADQRGVAFMRTGWAWSLCRGNRLGEARELLDAAIRTQRELADTRLEAFALNVLADVELRAGNVTAARAILGATLTSVRRVGDRWTIAHGSWLLARANVMEGRLEDAASLLSDSLQLRRQIGDRQGEAHTLFAQAELAHAGGHVDEARSLIREAQRIGAEIGDRLEIVECEAAMMRLSARGVPA